MIGVALLSLGAWNLLLTALYVGMLRTRVRQVEKCRSLAGEFPSGFHRATLLAVARVLCE